MRRSGTVLLAALLLQAALACGARPVIVLDPGHTPQNGGALGLHGIREVVYNDRFSARLATALQAAGFEVVLTRQAQENLELIERARIANQHPGALFLAIHHDSAQSVFLKQLPAHQGGGFQTLRPIGGYSLFVSRRNPQFAASLRLAQQLGRELRALGRPPTLHHAEDIAGERRELLDRALGIYRFDDLVVLAKTEMPAVLIEVGLIVDADDERYVSRPDKQLAMCRAVVSALQAYLAAEQQLAPEKGPAAPGR